MMGDKDAAAERLRTSVMTAGAALTFASGLSLLALSRWTPAVFACNLLLQGGLSALGPTRLACHRTRGKQRDAVRRSAPSSSTSRLLCSCSTLGWMGGLARLARAGHSRTGHHRCADGWPRMVPAQTASAGP